MSNSRVLNAKKEHLDIVKEFIRKEGIQLFAPSHCTGIDKIMEILKEFPDITKPAFCGTVFEF